VLLDSLVPPEVLGKLEIPVTLERPELPEYKVPLAQPVILEIPEQLDILVSRVAQVRRALLVAQAVAVNRELQASTAPSAHRAPRELLDAREQDFQASPVPLVPPGMQGVLEQRVRRAQRDRLEKLDQLEQLVIQV
jgi:hypothetical protein